MKTGFIHLYTGNFLRKTKGFQNGKIVVNFKSKPEHMLVGIQSSLGCFLIYMAFMSRKRILMTNMLLLLLLSIVCVTVILKSHA